MLTKKILLTKIYQLFLYMWLGIIITSCTNEGIEKSSSLETVPDTNRFKIEVLATGIVDPTEIAVSSNGDVFVLERKGKVNFYNSSEKNCTVIGEIKVNLGHEDGLLGVALDPNFQLNKWVYMLYTPDPHREQRVSRFTFKNNQLDLTTEKVIIAYPIVPERHQGGSLAFDGAGNLFISTGENTKPTDINGHAPIDERPGHEINDSQRSAGNTNDLRGKILRIHPLPDGTYSIPEGNLFAPNTPKTRSEIYIMGCRNPFRIAIDQATSTLYWGDIGPDAGEDTEKGPKGHDEINRATTAGNYGWPYFIANNKAYTKIDPTTNQVLEKFNPQRPTNNSPNNSGLRDLPAAQSAWIWYPYDASKEFPIMGEGGRTAIAGGIFHFNKNNNNGFPEWFDKQLFIADWMRNHIKTVSQTKEGKIVAITSFLPNHKFTRPIDMQFGNDGCLYVLEYGSNWFDNTDARLIKISYQRGNIAPTAIMKASAVAGSVPLKVKFSSLGTFDTDHDKLIYEWRFDQGKNIQSRDLHPEFTFAKAGNYPVSLTVTDAKGNSTTASIDISAGNTPPEISVDFPNHGSFYWPSDVVRYMIKASDKEDGKLKEEQVTVKMKSFFAGAAVPQPYGEKLIQESDCKSCHQTEAKSVGPSFTQISHRYGGIAEETITQLRNKIIHGGSGVWGSYVMSAHPQLGIEEAKEMIKYILAIAPASDAKSNLSLSGNFMIPDGILNPKMAYGLSVKAADKGFQGQPSIGIQKSEMLRPAVLEAKKYDWCKDIINSGDYARMPFPNSAIAFYDINLKNVNSISLDYGYDFYNPSCVVECHIDMPNGELIGKVELLKKTNEATDMTLTFPIKQVSGKHKLYFTYHPDLKIHSPLNLKTIYFNK